MRPASTTATPCAALVLAQDARGTASAVAHLLTTYGLNALALPLSVLSTNGIGMNLYAWLPTLQYVIVDDTGATSAEVSPLSAPTHSFHLPQ